MSGPVRHVMLLTCAEVVERVTDLLGADLDASDRVRLEQHLLVCPPCTSHVQQMRDTIALARETHPSSIAPADAALAAFAKFKSTLPAAPRTLPPRATIGIGPLPPDNPHDRSAPHELLDANEAPKTAFKFLRSGAFGPMSGAAWPTQGAWMSASGPLVVGRNGIHVSRASDLACWLHDELWEVEIAGEQIAGPGCLVVERARPKRRIEAWSSSGVAASGGATRFGIACIAHARELVGDSVLLTDGEEAIRYGYPAVAAFNAAVAVAAGDETKFATERAWQSAWIAREMIG